MAGEFLSIPGNIKQLYLPFVLDPSNAINTSPINVVDDNGESLNKAGVGKTQLFSFKQTTLQKNNNASTGLLKIFPNSFSKVTSLYNDDLSYQTLYSYQEAGNFGNAAKIGKLDFQQSIINNIPTIQIREFLQDAKLDQMFQLFSAFARGFNAGTEKNISMKDIWESTKLIFKQIGPILKDSFEVAAKEHFPSKEVFVNESINGYDYIMKIPYLLYYRLIAATSTNIYEIPYSGKFIDSSNGNEGWNTKRGLAGLTTSENSFLGSIVNYFGKNIRINTSPTWDGADATTPVEIKIDFDLYNDSFVSDSDETSIMNFIFVNTLLPGNKWLQYHIFQHAPNLYDVKIDGINRYFMCAGKFEVEGKGVVRRPSQEFINKLFGKYKNPKFFSGDYIAANNIRIPDVYECHLTFTSLLPNNFNNFLYSYYMNSQMKVLSNTELHTGGVFNSAANRLAKNLQTIFRAGGSYGNSFSESIGDGSEVDFMTWLKENENWQAKRDEANK